VNNVLSLLLLINVASYSLNESQHILDPYTFNGELHCFHCHESLKFQLHFNQLELASY